MGVPHPAQLDGPSVRAVLGAGRVSRAYQGVIAVSAGINGRHQHPGTLRDNPPGVRLDVLSQLHVGPLAFLAGTELDPLEGVSESAVVYVNPEFYLNPLLR